MAPVVLAISSQVAASTVGLRAIVPALQACGVETWPVPTVNFGRHPGWGAPGGRAVEPADLAAMITAALAHPDAGRVTAITTGYFASPEQVHAVADVLEDALASRSLTVDPVLGDHDTGLYVPEDVEHAIRQRLIPKADLITPNAWEAERLTGVCVTDPASAHAAQRVLSRPCLISSVTVGERIGALYADDAHAIVAHTPRRTEVPRGVGDLLTAGFLGARLMGAPPPAALAEAVRRVDGAVAAIPSGAHELPGPAIARGVRGRAALESLTPTGLVLGVDGTPQGWIGVFRHIDDAQPPTARFFDTFDDVLTAEEMPDVIAVDMPIGFLETATRGGRACERDARARLKGRTSSVFSAPCRAALGDDDYPSALATNRAANGVGLSKQSFHLFPKMRQIDAAMTPHLQTRIRESHPELAFAILAGAPMTHPKRKAEGRAERLALLESLGYDRGFLDPHPFARSQVAPDDLLDAAVLALSATRIARGHALRLPAEPERDAKGLVMEIVV